MISSIWIETLPMTIYELVHDFRCIIDGISNNEQQYGTLRVRHTIYTLCTFIYNFTYYVLIYSLIKTSQKHNFNTINKTKSRLK